MDVTHILAELKQKFEQAETEAKREAVNQEIGRVLSSLTPEDAEAFFNAAMADISENSTENKTETFEIPLRDILENVLPMISVSYIAKNYLGKSSSWMYQRLNGNIVHGKKVSFTTQEKQQIYAALQDMAQKIAKVTF